jgi:hypothetical protein
LQTAYTDIVQGDRAGGDLTRSINSILLDAPISLLTFLLTLFVVIPVTSSSQCIDREYIYGHAFSVTTSLASLLCSLTAVRPGILSSTFGEKKLNCTASPVNAIAVQKTVLYAREFARRYACIPAAKILGFTPGTSTNEPEVSSSMYAGTGLAGNPACVTAFGTTAGMVCAKPFDGTETYTALVMLEMADRMEPAATGHFEICSTARYRNSTPTTVPISCWFNNSMPAFERHTLSFQPMKKVETTRILVASAFVSEFVAAIATFD